jgi:hypothetical protein
VAAAHDAEIAKVLASCICCERRPCVLLANSWLLIWRIVQMRAKKEALETKAEDLEQALAAKVCWAVLYVLVCTNFEC